ncbi:F0F1 ATP synthase subunit delta [Microbacterium schleiferi]|uniref:F0F1 ATP synthase subunit delta n=1 Tax=Microbacterium schleiferi TaxID=69362 RepID=UPI001D1723C6|nr:F0F1 ATP synthase subunit delta [Microbacterium schleiferi]MCC4267168.1 F0F1 ATP synthase subunit delta [Microbacterium schleiferi]
MGSATNQALAETTAALAAARSVDLTVARELFVAARELGQTSQLSGALADSAAAPAARAKVITDVFGPSMAPATVGLLTNAVQQRWSSASDLIDGIEELAVRAATFASDADVESELFEFSRTVAANPELELALGSRLGDASAKGDLVAKLLNGRASEATVLVASSLVQQPRERRVRQLLSRAIRIVADERGRAVATVTAAAPLSAEQVTRLTELLSRRYGTKISLNTVIDPTVVGGLRVQIADDVIDMSVSSRLADLRQRLAG